MPSSESAAESGKRYFRGTHRTCSPEETWARIEPHFGRIGITRVADVTALDCLGIPVYQSIRPASRNLCVSQGKAVTRIGAKVSAAMEAIELWHAESLGHLDQVEAPLREMAHDNPIPFSAFPWRPDARRLEEAVLPWVSARSLTGGADGWLLRQMLEIDFALPRDLQPRMFHVTSNGLASGNDPSEALLHAVCELIERHGLYLARKLPGRLVPLDPDSVETDFCREQIDRVRAASMKLALYDITWEAGVPVIVADLVAPDLANVWRGSGCHPCAAIALSRALSEAAQSRLTYIAGARDDLTRFVPRNHYGEVFEDFVEPVPRRRFDSLADLSGDSVDADLGTVLTRIAALGFDAYAVDLTRPEIDIAVVMAFVPGFREAAYG